MARDLHARERGQVLILVAILLPMLLGMAGIAVDVGLGWSLRRDTQNIADAAALAGGGLLLDNGPASVATAKTTAAKYVTDRGLACPAANCVHVPPISGPHTGDSTYIEVSLAGSRKTVFMRALGKQSYTVRSRAVAIVTALAKEYALIVLKNDCAANNGTVSGNATYQQNTSGAGLTINNGGAAVNSACEPSANLGGGSIFKADFVDYNSDGAWQQANNAQTTPKPEPIGAPVADPLASLAQPTPGAPSPTCGGCTAANPVQRSINAGDGNVTLEPGTYYGGLNINQGTGGGYKVTLKPGLYIFAGGASPGGGFSFEGSGDLDGSAGVTLFNTGNPLASKKPDRPCVGMKISGSGTIVLNAPTTGPNNGMLIWQDKNCTADFQYAGSTNTTTSIIYLPTARINLSGGGTLGANQVIVGSIDFNGSAGITINYKPAVQAYMPKVKLVE